MSEHINSGSWLASGGHVWLWDAPTVFRKDLTSAGIDGNFSFTVAIGSRRGRIAGRRGSPALLKAASNAAMTTIENTIEALQTSGAEVAWEDDLGHSGSLLVVTNYRRVGERLYSPGKVWQYYILEFQENGGGG